MTARPPAPLPPQTLAAYDQLVPGAAERIMTITELSATASADIAGKIANAETETARKARNMVAALTILSLAAAAAFFALGNRIAGLAFAAFSLITFIRLLAAR